MTLAASEWDFRPLLPLHKASRAELRELNAAIVYEYGRESPSIIKLAKRFESLPDDLRAQAMANNLYPLRYESPSTAEVEKLEQVRFWNCILWPGRFPSVPWLKIPAEERKARIEQSGDTEKVIMTFNERDTIEPWEFPKPGTRFFSGSIELMITTIDWASANNSDLVEAFAKWVQTSRPAQYSEPRGDGTREAVNAAFLTRLGTMRLLHHFTHEDACRVTEKARALFPQKQSNASGARIKVAEHMRAIFLSDAFEAVGVLPLIPKGEKPLSWQTVTKRKREGRR